MTRNYLALAIGCLGVCAPAAAEDVSLSMGIRAWQNTWRVNSIAVDAAGNVVRPYQLVGIDAPQRTTGIPFALVRYGSFGVSASAFLGTGYTVLGQGTTRREADVNAAAACDARLGQVASDLLLDAHCWLLLLQQVVDCGEADCDDGSAVDACSLLVRNLLLLGNGRQFGVQSAIQRRNETADRNCFA